MEDWWSGVMSTRDDDLSTTCRIVIMQRLHETDLSGHILKNEDGWIHLKLPIRYNPADRCSTSLGFKDPRTSSGELLWTNRYTPEQEATLRKRLGSYRASGQLDQLPAPAAGGKLKRSWWKWYEEDPREIALRCDEIIQSWDMPFKKREKTAGGKKPSDFLCCTVWGRIGSDKYLLDIYIARREFTEAIEDFNMMYLKWPNAKKKLVEDKAYGTIVISTLKHKVPGIVEVEPHGSKMDRVISAAPEVEAGNCYLPNKIWVPGVDKFVDNCALFPNAENDDDVDTFTQAINHWSEDVDIYSVIGVAA